MGQVSTEAHMEGQNLVQMRSFVGSLTSLIAAASAMTFLSCAGDTPSTPSNTACHVSPDTLSFGTVIVGQARQKDFTITNVGETDLPLKVDPAFSPFFLSFIDTSSFTLAPGDSKTATVTFAPQDSTAHTLLLTIGAHCSSVFCVGKGANTPVTSCSVYPEAVDFGWVLLGEHVDTTFVLLNDGTETVQITFARTCGDYSFLLESLDHTLAPGESLVAPIRFTPTRPGTRDCTFPTDSPCGRLNCQGFGIRKKAWLVRQDGLGDAPSIQAAIDSSVSGDSVLVEPGRYFENINYLTKNVVITSTAGPELTIIDGSTEPGAVVSFEVGIDRNAILEGFTITGGTGNAGYWVYPYGGGIFIQNASPTIRGNIIARNTAYGNSAFGGGIYCGGSLSMTSSAPLISGNVIRENQAHAGGGIMIETGSPILRNNVISNNRSDFDGGGIFIWRNLDYVLIEGNRLIENEAGDHGGGIASWNVGSLGGAATVDMRWNVFLRNTAKGEDIPGVDTGTGGAIHLAGLRGFVVNNTLVGNISANSCEGGGISLLDVDSNWIIERNIIAFNLPDGLSCLDVRGPAIRENLLFGNNGSDFGCPERLCEPQSGNYVADPMFCGLGSDDLSVSENSPALAHGQAIGAVPTPGCH